MTFNKTTLLKNLPHQSVHSLVMFLLLLMALFYLLLTSDGNLLHWLVIPTILAGTLMSKDTIGWITSKLDIFDPTALVALFSIHYFFFAPLLQVEWDYWPYIPSLSQDRAWVGIWALLCACGALCYHISMRYCASQPVSQPTYQRRLNYHYFMLFGLGFLAVALVAQLYVYAKFGGISGFVQAYSLRTELSKQVYNPFKGMGALMALAESFPNILALLATVFLRNKKYAQNLIFFGGYILIFLAIAFMFGGLTGSRKSTIISVLWAIILYHYLIMPITKKILLAGVVAFVVFNSVYYWYKIGGTAGLHAIYDTELRYELTSSDTHSQFAVVRDFGRMDFQTYTLKTIIEDDHPLSYGRSLVAGALAFIPKSLLPSRLENSAQEKNELLYGVGNFDRDGMHYSTLVLGLPGELTVNFGIVGFIAGFVLLGVSVGLAKRYITSLEPDDPRMLLAPIFIILPLQILLSDSNIITTYFFKFWLFPALLVFISTRKYALRQL